MAVCVSRYLEPRETARDVFSIDYEGLWQRGIRGLIFDLDNTLCLWRQGPPSGEMLGFLGDLRRQGFRICVLSNGHLSSQPEVLSAFSDAGIPLIWPARKPLPWGFKRALSVLGTRPEETAVIGDQLLTDVLGGNLLGLHTILVDPLSPMEHPWTRLFSRTVERFLGRRLRR